MQEGSNVSIVKSNESNSGATEGMAPELQPLLEENNHQTKPSHRSLGVLPPEPISRHNSGNNHSEDDPPLPRDPSDELFLMRKKYRKFIHKSKVLMNFMIFINTLWLVTTLISDFFFNVSFMRNRLTSFQDLTLIFVSIISNNLTLWFNRLGLYSSLDQYMSFVMVGFTLFNLMVNLFVKYIRTRIGLLGICTYIWAAVSFALSGILDNYLFRYNAKFHPYFANDIDHENQTRNIASRHTLSEWFIIGFRNAIKGILLMFFILFTLNNILYSLDSFLVSKNVNEVTELGSSATYDSFHWVDSDHTYQIHITCYGNVFDSDKTDKDLQSIILFEHGGSDTAYLSGTWIQELYHLNRVKRYCTYERPGYGLSDSPPAPMSIAMIVDALKYALVTEAGIHGPFIAVGYDFGGLITQVFAAKNIDIVEGMLLIDSWHPDILLKNYISRLLPGDNPDDPENDNKLPSEVKRHNLISIWWKGLLSTFNMKLQTSWLFAHHGSMERILGRDMIYQSKYLRTKFLESVSGSLLSYKDVMNSHSNLHEIKMSVVSSKELIKKSSQWGNWQRELSKLSLKTQEWTIVDGGHEFYKHSLGKQETQNVLLRLIDVNN